MKDERWVPDDIPLDKPNAARMYDYMLGGYHNFEIDRAVSDKMKAVFPDVFLAAQANRAFLRRAVTYLAERGIDQFLDLGSGIPTVGSVHEVVQALNPEARVVYVDREPVAVAHSNALLKDNPLATAIQMDVRDTDELLNHPTLQEMLDFDRPLGLLMVAIMHYILDDEEARSIVETLYDALAPDSCVAIAMGSSEFEPPSYKELAALFGMADSSRNRSRAEIMQFLSGLEMVEPGLVFTPEWRPEDPSDVLYDRPEYSLALCAVGCKR